MRNEARNFITNSRLLQEETRKWNKIFPRIDFDLGDSLFPRSQLTQSIGEGSKINFIELM